jgi:adenylylsulfate kinase
MSGTVVWITGLPSSGKSTLAQALSLRLRASQRPVALLDSDEVRAALAPRLGYGPADRDSFYETLAQLAALLARQGLIALVAATANRRAYRDRARALAPRFLEVYVEVPAPVCRLRDSKGLYAGSAAEELPGAGAPYEPPAAPEVIAHGGRDAAAVEKILGNLEAL